MNIIYMLRCRLDAELSYYLSVITNVTPVCRLSGLGNCLAPMFLTEIAPINLRGAIGTINQLSVTLGILVSSVFGLPSILGVCT